MQDNTAATQSPIIRAPGHVPLVHKLRGGIVERVYYGSVIVLSPDGRITFQAGDIDAAFYPRSALKPMQAVAMLRAGLPLDGELLALSAASHPGGPGQISGVRRILATGGLSERDLANTASLPHDPMTRLEWIARGDGPSRIAQNCSGKHAAMLLTSRMAGWATAGYLERQHPLQRIIADTVVELSSQPTVAVTTGECGASQFAMSLLGLTRAFARITSAPRFSEEGRLASAMRHHTEMASGSRPDIAQRMLAVPGLLAKESHEAVQIAALPDGRAVGVKMADGSERARLLLTATALALCGACPEPLAKFTAALSLASSRTAGQLRVTGKLALWSAAASA
ncbi:asparaginase [Streptomyces chartreusis]|uniref:asparaginase n=1 Tax=Streptomyces chartreusis TaxID=1969 RepID=UPI0038124959